LVEWGVEEGANLVTGGQTGRRAWTEAISFKPTVFGNVSNDMTIASEEIFGPVPVILCYGSVNQAAATAAVSPQR
jgi:aldehyde dehydrogenase (NAD+)